MAVRWWVLTDNRFFRYLLSQMSPFGVHFSNVILYRMKVDRLLEQARPTSSGLVFQVLGPEDHATATALAQISHQHIGTCRGSDIVFAIQDGAPVGHVCWSCGTHKMGMLEREEMFDDGVYLFSMFTSPTVRRRGVAKLLTMCAVEHAIRKADPQYAYMYVDTENLASRRLVESLGFEAVRVTHFLRVLRLTSYQNEVPPASVETPARSVILCTMPAPAAIDGEGNDPARWR